MPTFFKELRGNICPDIGGRKVMWTGEQGKNEARWGNMGRGGEEQKKLRTWGKQGEKREREQKNRNRQKYWENRKGRKVKKRETGAE